MNGSPAWQTRRSESDYGEYDGLWYAWWFLSSVWYRRVSLELRFNRNTVYSGQAARAGGFHGPHGNGLTLLLIRACLSNGLRKRSADRGVLNWKRQCHVGLWELKCTSRADRQIFFENLGIQFSENSARDCAGTAAKFQLSACFVRAGFTPKVRRLRRPVSGLACEP